MHIKLPKHLQKSQTYIFIIGVAIQMSVFKYLYPRADYTFNSLNYIQDAISNVDFGLWPIGYSKFLFYLHNISQTDTIVTATQYIFIQASAFVLFLTLQRFFQLPAHIKNTIFVILIFNPLSLYISNYILPDALFAAISLLWVANLITIIHKPNITNISTQAVLIALLILLKMQGLFYPIVSIVTLSFINRRLWFKTLAITLTLITTLSTTELISQMAQKESGHRQLSAILSWQIANNALYGYSHIDTTNIFTSVESARFSKRMTSIVTSDSTYVTPFDGSAYLYAFESPLRRYWLGYVLQDTNRTETQGWCRLAPTIFDWGTAVIQASPSTYTKYYLLPNTVNYLFPLTNDVARYNSGELGVSLSVKEWFCYQSQLIECRFPNIQRRAFLIFSAMFLVTNLIILIGILLLIFKKYPFGDAEHRKPLIIFLISFYSVNALFSIALQPVDILSVAFSSIIYPCFLVIILNLFSKPEPLSKSRQPILG